MATKTYGTESVERQRTMSVKDLAAGFEKGFGQTTLEFKISLVRPITPKTGLIRAEGKVLSPGRRIGTTEGHVTDGKGRLLAHGTTTCLIFPN
jgi:uncharacterized protein (TIGR00369 family)